MGETAVLLNVDVGGLMNTENTKREFSMENCQDHGK